MIFALANREVRKTAKGFRLWQTTDVPGKPISPFFTTMEALCVWAATNATIWADKKLSADEWMIALTGKTPAAVKII